MYILSKYKKILITPTLEMLDLDWDDFVSDFYKTGNKLQSYCQGYGWIYISDLMYNFKYKNYSFYIFEK